MFQSNHTKQNPYLLVLFIPRKHGSLFKFLKQCKITLTSASMKYVLDCTPALID